MSVTTTRYVRKPLFVDAVRITEVNFEEIAAWCQGEISQDEETNKKYIKIRVHNPKNPRQTKAFAGDWLLYTERGYKVYTSKAFHGSFDEQSTVQTPIAYPYDGGGVTVLGPELFAQPDGSVLCWKGTNYIPQSESHVASEKAQENGAAVEIEKPTAETVD